MEQRLLTAAQLADYGRELKSLCGPAGGEDGYGGVADESGEIAANTSLPMPGFTFQGLPDGAEPTDISFTSSNGSSWMVELYPGLPEDAARPLYTISPAPGSETASVRLQFKVGDNVVTDDGFDISSAVNQTLKMSIYPNSLENVSAYIDGSLYNIELGEIELWLEKLPERDWAA